ncbi:MAG TPA: thermonuclease family protein [Pseudoneobacillus sp.]|jgi:endonuclease YncB( thermonuclease family)|nr:thermonuclease family protein [Pseudoneobacillus sp.]
MDLYCFPAKCTRVVDGDTVEVEFFLLPEKVFPQIKMTQKLRLLGVNTPELHSKNAEEKTAAYNAKTFTTSEVLNKDVVINITGSDAFGRLLTTLYIDGENLNALLLHDGFAKPYERG